MRVGRLRWPLTYQRALTQRTDRGGETVIWHPWASDWADVVDLTGAEVPLQGTVALPATTRATVRYRADLTAEMRAVHDGRTYEIVALREIARRWLELDLREVR